jgi:hypothetical protein
MNGTSSQNGPHRSEPTIPSPEPASATRIRPSWGLDPNSREGTWCFLLVMEVGLCGQPDVSYTGHGAGLSAFSPPSVHRQPGPDAGRGVRAPRSRDRRAGHRRPEERTTGPPALRIVRGQQPLAGLRDHRVQRRAAAFAVVSRVGRPAVFGLGGRPGLMVCQEMALMPAVAQDASISPVGAPETPMPATTLPPRDTGSPPGRMLKPWI